MEHEHNASKGCFHSSFDGKELLTNTQRFILVSFSAVAIILAVFSNSLMIFILVKTKQLHNTSLKLLLLLSISDFLFASCAGTNFIIILLKYFDQRYCTIEIVAEFLMVLFGRLSAYILVLLAIDRYCRIRYLTHYSQVFTKRRFLIGITAIHLIALFLPVLTLCTRQYHKDTLLGAVNVLATSLDMIFLFVGITVYMLAVHSSRQHQKNATNQALLRETNKSFAQLAKLIVIAAFVLYLPYNAAYIVKLALDKITRNTRRWLQFAIFASYVLLFCNSIANALIFLCRNSEAKKYICKTKVCKCIKAQRDIQH